MATQHSSTLMQSTLDHFFVRLWTNQHSDSIYIWLLITVWILVCKSLSLRPKWMVRHNIYSSGRWLKQNTRIKDIPRITDRDLCTKVSVIRRVHCISIYTILSRHVRVWHVTYVVSCVLCCYSLNVMVCQPGTILYISVISRPELTSAHEEATTTCLDIHVKQLWYSTVTIIHTS